MLIIEKENRRKYLKPPTMAQVDSFVKLCKVSEYQFEEFFGLPRGTIKVVRTGYMKMPVKFWHIFYERIIPEKGHEIQEIRYDIPMIKDIPVAERKQEPAESKPLTHGRLSLFK